ncbi:MAG: two-component system cell cycle response regulator [Candidatus Azotimanducaceae bacterium]|jgi:two-component system cell cycle response regulator
MSDNTQFRELPEGPQQAPVTDGKRPCLIMIKGDFIGEVYELDPSVTMIGRSDDVNLTVSDISISRRHAMIVYRDKEFYVSDLDSTNGTFVNKELVGSARLLREGDKLTVGSIIFKFSYQDDEDTEYHMMLRNMAIKDGLTRIYNKRYFNEMLDKEFDFNLRNNSGLSVVMFDIDHFKTVNDTYGHPAGDHILKEIARLVEHAARGYDIFARFGGEEFIFLMRAAQLDAAINLANRVRSAVETHKFVYDDTEIKITVSLGVSHWDGNDSQTSAKCIIEAVDKKLYEAKHNGRNTVCY